MTFPYTDDQISIDGTFVKIGSGTYAVSTINSVHATHWPARFTGLGSTAAFTGSALGLFGLFSFVGGAGSAAFAFIAPATILWVIAILTRRDPHNALIFETSSGQVTALSSPDRRYIQKLQLLVQDAMKLVHDANLSKATLQSGTKVADEDLMECPRCAELVRRRARACRFCGYEISSMGQA